jgi:hypothetical protein
MNRKSYQQQKYHYEWERDNKVSAANISSPNVVIKGNTRIFIVDTKHIQVLKRRERTFEKYPGRL